MPGLWHVGSLETRTARVRSESLGRDVVTSELWADGALLANALERADFGDDELQAVLCRECFIPHCEGGGWLRPRWSGDRLVLAPAWSSMARSGARDAYLLPQSVLLRGVPLLAPPLARQLVRLAPALDEPRRPLTASDVARLVTFAAPEGALDVEDASRAVRAENVLASLDGTVADEIASFERLVRAAENDDDPRELRPLRDDERLVTFFFDLPNHPDWSPIARDPSGAERLVVDGWVACDA